VGVAHEFFHGIQWRLDSGKWDPSQWKWFTEGQARFLPSVQYDTEEFLNADHFFPRDANGYLTSRLNWSVADQWYNYCLFWRYMYEHFKKDTLLPQPKTALQLVRDCYAANVGTNNSIGRGKAAIEAALLQNGNVLPGWNDFDHVLDQFAVACYLNDPSFNKWNLNPPGIYSSPDLTLDSTFRLGPDETDSYIKDDSIPHSFGIDLMQVALDGRVPAGGLDKQSTGSRLAALAERV
jgi:hypothetical protein